MTSAATNAGATGNAPANNLQSALQRIITSDKDTVDQANRESAMAIPPGIIPADTLAKDNAAGPEASKSTGMGPSNGSTPIGGVVGGQAAGGGRTGGPPQPTSGDAATASTKPQ